MRIINLLLLMLLILILTASTLAQTNQKSTLSKVAVIDTSVFNNEVQGIKRLVLAQRSFNVEYFYEQSLTKQIETLEKELFPLEKQSKSFCEKNLELQKLKDELTRARQATKAEYEKKYSLIVAPITKKIHEKLKEFSKIKGYAIVVEKLEILYFPSLIDGIDDITLEFIKFCNETFEKEKSQ